MALRLPASPLHTCTCEGRAATHACITNLKAKTGMPDFRRNQAYVATNYAMTKSTPNTRTQELTYGGRTALHGRAGRRLTGLIKCRDLQILPV